MDATDIALLRRCAELGHLANSVDTAFSVGAVVVDIQGRELATGFSRELGPTWHAEAVALRKARDAGLLDQAHTLYCSLEPCLSRQSGRRPCCDLILHSPIRRIVFIADEPPIFVPGKGGDHLTAAGLTVDRYPELTDLVRAANAHIWPADI